MYIFLCLRTINTGKIQTNIFMSKDTNKKMLKSKKNILFIIQMQDSRSNLALDIMKQWKYKARGKKKRIEKGLLLALSHKLPCYSPCKIKSKFNIKNKYCLSL